MSKSDAQRLLEMSEQVGKMLRVFRESVGMTKVAVASGMGTGEGTVRRLELGSNSPNVGTLISYMQATDGQLVLGIQPKNADSGPD